jgi:O-antigen/teichoic acid export membrane protein
MLLRRNVLCTKVMGLITTFVRPLRSQLYTNAGYLWLGNIGFALLSFAFWNIIAQLHSPEIVGLAGTTLTSIILLSDVSQLGLGYTLIRFIPQSGEGARVLLGRSFAAGAVASLLISLIFLSTLTLWSQGLRDLLWDSPGRAGSFLLFVVFSTVWALMISTLIGYRRADFVLAQRLTVAVARLPLAVLLGVPWSALGIVAGHGLAVLGGILLAVLVLLPQCTGRVRYLLALDLWRLAPQAPFALTNLVSHVLTVMVWHFLPLIVIALAGAEAAGFFYIGWAVSGLVVIMIQQLSLSLLAEGSYDIQGLRRQAQGALLVGLALGGLYAVLIYFFGGFVLLLFGREYVEQSSSVLKVLAAAIPLAAVTNLYLSIERVLQHLVSLVVVSAIVTIVMLGAIVVLIPRMGIVGAGYGVMVGYGVGALISLPMLYPMMKRSHHLVGTGQSTAP